MPLSPVSSADHVPKSSRGLRWFMSVSTRRMSGAACAGALSVAVTACAEFGFTDRVLWRVPSPDGRLVAVCQEVPEFDGPSYDVRLERADRTLLRALYRIGDGDPCSEMAWSPDGRTLAVLSGHVARVRFVDVASALDRPTKRSYSSGRQVDLHSRVLSPERQQRERLLVQGQALRFVEPLVVELELCPYSLDAPRSDQRRACHEPASIHRFEVPSGAPPQVAGAAP
jgi:hypothetical protein